MRAGGNSNEEAAVGALSVVREPSIRLAPGRPVATETQPREGGDPPRAGEKVRLVASYLQKATAPGSP